MSKLEKFLEELSELTKKHGLAIGGCGCCDSPWIDNLETDEEEAGNLWYSQKDGKYHTDETR